tara:strand:- start:164 stop:436 length:273 start_codon:yes stop_codon:yes gene_type:complete
MRFVAVCLLLFSFVVCLDNTCFAKTDIQLVNLSYVAADAADENNTEEDAEACDRGCRVKACFVACGAKMCRVFKACRGWKPFRGRCSSCS